MAAFMALLMFSSSIAFSMDVHFCGNELQSLNFFGTTKSCEMTKVDKVVNHSCCKESQNDVEKCDNPIMEQGSCCHNETIVLESNGDSKTFDFSFDQIQQVIVLAVILLPNFDLFELFTEKPNFVQYDPPIILKDISILHQVFRI
ncbi:MAG: hypothetical protein WC044_07900 [Crocinitomicaceae bacterium]